MPHALGHEVPADQIVWINGFPAPPAPPVRRLHAVASTLKLMANKEDTRQVFEVLQALSGASSHKLFRKFTSTAYGRRVVNGEVELVKILGDRERLRKYADGSLGRAYLEFMEGENLTPDGLLASAKEAGIDYEGETQFPEFRRMFLHVSVSHDLWHVLTGYGRDAMGELLNLVFTRTQSFNPGVRLMTTIGLLAQKAEAPQLPLLEAMKQARRIGDNVDFLLQHDVEALLSLPLAEARKKLGFSAPTIYQQVPDSVKTALLKPKVKATQTERETEFAKAA
jgi:ubiquinone biosynthesis protein COQ4